MLKVSHSPKLLKLEYFIREERNLKLKKLPLFPNHNFEIYVRWSYVFDLSLNYTSSSNFVSN